MFRTSLEYGKENKIKNSVKTKRSKL